MKCYTETRLKHVHCGWCNYLYNKQILEQAGRQGVETAVENIADRQTDRHIHTNTHNQKRKRFYLLEQKVLFVLGTLNATHVPAFVH